MKLEEAWRFIIKMENSKQFNCAQILSILADLGVFSTNPRIRLVLKSALQHKLWKIICKTDVSDVDINNLRAKLIYDGFAEDLINQLLTSLESIISFSLDTPIELKASIRSNNDTDINSIEISNTTTTAEIKLDVSGNYSFLGIPIGSSYFTFENEMFARHAYQKKRSKSEISFVLPNFIFNRTAQVAFCKLPILKPVFKITVSFETQNESESDSLFIRIAELYKNKYGKPARYERCRSFEWYKNNTSITIILSSSKYVEIIYRLHTPQLDQLEKREREEEDQKRQQEQHQKKWLEESARRYEDERKKLELRKLLDDI